MSFYFTTSSYFLQEKEDRIAIVGQPQRGNRGIIQMNGVGVGNPSHSGGFVIPGESRAKLAPTEEGYQRPAVSFRSLHVVVSLPWGVTANPPLFGMLSPVTVMLSKRAV